MDECINGSLQKNFTSSLGRQPAKRRERGLVIVHFFRSEIMCRVNLGPHEGSLGVSEVYDRFTQVGIRYMF